MWPIHTKSIEATLGVPFHYGYGTDIMVNTDFLDAVEQWEQTDSL